MRVGVLVVVGAEEQAAAVEFTDQLCGDLNVFDESTLEAGDLRSEVAVEADRVVERRVGAARFVEAGFDRDAVVVFAVCRGDVDQAGAVVGGHELAGDHFELPGAAVAQLEYGPFVAPADQLGRGHGRGRLHAFAEDLLDQGLGQDQGLRTGGSVDFDSGVGDLRVDRDRVVARQGPRGGGPDQQRLAGALAVVTEQRESHVDGRVGHVLVPERDFV